MAPDVLGGRHMCACVTVTIAPAGVCLLPSTPVILFGGSLVLLGGSLSSSLWFLGHPHHPIVPSFPGSILEEPPPQYDIVCW
ncbi:hypothetical protein C8R46DRAFT_1232079 [Mycena filopes]|nr:hypothetical protein C8R46DRAFT_1232079 [Mycena filopes]